MPPAEGSSGDIGRLLALCTGEATLPACFLLTFRVFARARACANPPGHANSLCLALRLLRHHRPRCSPPCTDLMFFSAHSSQAIHHAVCLPGLANTSRTIVFRDAVVAHSIIVPTIYSTAPSWYETRWKQVRLSLELFELARCFTPGVQSESCSLDLA